MAHADSYGQIIQDPIGRLSQFPFIGPITANHLAKNLGYQLAKDDRHLQRIALRFGYKSAQGLCADISAVTGDSIAVVDTILWRDSALNGRISIMRASARDRLQPKGKRRRREQ